MGRDKSESIERFSDVVEDKLSAARAFERQSLNLYKPSILP